MPIPIRPRSQQPEKNTYLDYSFLANHMPAQKKVVTASDKDAEALMKIWLNAEQANGQYKITSSVELSSREIMRLKSQGFVTGSSSQVEFTDRGKKVITVMALGEGNNFQANRTDKSYIEILASMDHRGKSGYRTPKFAANNSNSLRVNNDPKE